MKSLGGIFGGAGQPATVERSTSTRKVDANGVEVVLERSEKVTMRRYKDGKDSSGKEPRGEQSGTSVRASDSRKSTSAGIDDGAPRASGVGRDSRASEASTGRDRGASSSKSTVGTGIGSDGKRSGKDGRNRVGRSDGKASNGKDLTNRKAVDDGRPSRRDTTKFEDNKRGSRYSPKDKEGDRENGQGREASRSRATVGTGIGSDVKRSGKDGRNRVGRSDSRASNGKDLTDRKTVDDGRPSRKDTTKFEDDKRGSRYSPKDGESDRENGRGRGKKSVRHTNYNIAYSDTDLSEEKTGDDSSRKDHRNSKDRSKSRASSVRDFTEEKTDDDSDGKDYRDSRDRRKSRASSGRNFREGKTAGDDSSDEDNRYDTRRTLRERECRNPDRGVISLKNRKRSEASEKCAEGNAKVRDGKRGTRIDLDGGKSGRDGRSRVGRSGDVRDSSGRGRKSGNVNSQKYVSEDVENAILLWQESSIHDPKTVKSIRASHSGRERDTKSKSKSRSDGKENKQRSSKNVNDKKDSVDDRTGQRRDITAKKDHRISSGRETQLVRDDKNTRHGRGKRFKDEEASDVEPVKDRRKSRAAGTGVSEEILKDFEHSKENRNKNIHRDGSVKDGVRDGRKSRAKYDDDSSRKSRMSSSESVAANVENRMDNRDMSSRKSASAGIHDTLNATESKFRPMYTGCSKKTDTQFYFWDNFGNSASILTILSLLQAEIYRS